MSSDGVERHFCDDFLAAFQAGLDALAITRLAGLDQFHAFSKPQDNALLPHVIDKRVHDFMIDEGQQPLADLDQGDADAQRGEHASVFAADDAAADHSQVSRQVIQLQQAVAGEDILSVEGDMIWLGDCGADGDQDIARRQLVFAFLVDEMHMHGMVIDDGGDAGDQLDAVSLQLHLVDFDLMADDMVGAHQQVVHGDVLLDGVGRAIDGALAKAGQMQDGFAQGL